jgi:Protein of unknown function (DUF2946)
MRPVSTLRLHLRQLCWVALLAVFGLAVAPTISHAMAGAQAKAGWTEVCTPQGSQWVSLADSGGPAQPDTAGSHLEHCPLCGLAGAAVGLPPAAPAVQPPAGLQHAVPRLFLQSPRPLFAWAAAQPRGPPAA